MALLDEVCNWGNYELLECFLLPTWGSKYQPTSSMPAVLYAVGFHNGL